MASLAPPGIYLFYFFLMFFCNAPRAERAAREMASAERAGQAGLRLGLSRSSAGQREGKKSREKGRGAQGGRRSPSAGLLTSHRPCHGGTAAEMYVVAIGPVCLFERKSDCQTLPQATVKVSAPKVLLAIRRRASEGQHQQTPRLRFAPRSPPAPPAPNPADPFCKAALGGGEGLPRPFPLSSLRDTTKSRCLRGERFRVGFYSCFCKDVKKKQNQKLIKRSSLIPCWYLKYFHTSKSIP